MLLRNILLLYPRKHNSSKIKFGVQQTPLQILNVTHNYFLVLDINIIIKLPDYAFIFVDIIAVTYNGIILITAVYVRCVPCYVETSFSCYRLWAWNLLTLR